MLSQLLCMRVSVMNEAGTPPLLPLFLLPPHLHMYPNPKVGCLGSGMNILKAQCKSPHSTPFYTGWELFNFWGFAAPGALLPGLFWKDSHPSKREKEESPNALPSSLPYLVVQAPNTEGTALGHCVCWGWDISLIFKRPKVNYIYISHILFGWVVLLLGGFARAL